MVSRKNWFDEVGSKDLYATLGDCQELEFTHGIEVEYFLVNNQGRKLSYADFGEVYNSTLSDWLIQALEHSIPRFYLDKTSSIKIGPSKSSTNDALYINYKAKDKLVRTELMSIDRNVVESPLVELATPPCDSFYELGWWSSTILALINERLNKLGNNHHLMAFGVNPYERVEDITQSDSFPTCGEHHHIKIVEQKNMDFNERAFFTNFYHLVRFFTGYLILLSACSPFTSGRLWGSYRSNDPKLPFPRCVRSIRVLYNKKHLCNFQEGEYMPYLEKGWVDRSYFVNEFKRQSGSYRNDTHFLDMDPYSNKTGTTEIRFFDSQPSIARRVGLAAIIQMLAIKAKKLMIKDEMNILEILKENNLNLHAVKKMSCEGGFWFKPSREAIFRNPNNMSKLKPSDMGRSVLSDLVLEMLYFLGTEINERNLVHSHFLDPIRHSIYGMKGKGMSPALYWLFVFVNFNQDMSKVVNRILDSSKKGINIWYDPIVNEPFTLSQFHGPGGSR
jgi:gamma-glutamyl:cysteine ligase YbdK (ATP-grasp superfamily)